MGKLRYIGFVVDGFLPSIFKCLRFESSPRALLSGWPSGSSVALMRFQWVARYVNQNRLHCFQYELYRPWRKYAGVIFLKSMRKTCAELAYRLRTRRVKTIFDTNVDYFTSASGTFYYEGMAPTIEQHQAAIEMAELCDAVIGDSKYLTKVASKYNSRTKWIPDNVVNYLITPTSSWKPGQAKLPLLWSGESIKLFELLLIGGVLIEYSGDVSLKLVTNSLGALDSWYPPYKAQFLDLLTQVQHEFIPFTSVEKLMEVYGAGGVCISPRFLNNTYNQGHTEWKITLAMARGRVALCSEMPSYLDVFERSGGVGIRICRNQDDWHNAFQDVLSSDFHWEKEQLGAAEVVKNYYSTEVVGKSHADFINDILSGKDFGQE